MERKKTGICPKCSCQIVTRIPRRFIEKMVIRKKKYRCAECKSEFFHNSSTKVRKKKLHST